MPPWAALCVLIAPITLALCLPYTGRLLRGWTWCLVTRHRVRAFLCENGIRNRSGKLPWILATYPTPVGERVWLLLIAGMSIEDVKDRTSALAATCWAADARLDRTRRMAGVLRIDIIRRDPLDSKRPLPSTLVGKTIPGTAEHIVTPAAANHHDAGLGTRHLLRLARTPLPPHPLFVCGPSSLPRNQPLLHPHRPTAQVLMVNGEDVSDYV